MNLRRQTRRRPRNEPSGWFLQRAMRKVCVVSLMFCLMQTMAPGAGGGQEESMDEYKLKSAILYHLTQFVEWPDTAYPDRHAPILLCILGQDPFANSLASGIPKESDSGRAMQIRHLQSDVEFPGCHILYISSSERKTVAHTFSILNGFSILTVGEMAQFANHGGIVQFSLEDRHVRFAINVDAASRAGLKISSKLLALAQIVRD
jgi:YfiR/HmsC-like